MQALGLLEFSQTEPAVNKGKTAVIVGAQWGDEGKGKIVAKNSFSSLFPAAYCARGAAA